MARKHKKSLPEGEFTANIDDLSHDGHGVAHINGKTTFIFNALPGESVQFHYTYSRKKFDHGIATTISNASPERATPKCPHFGICGGCSLQHLKPFAQISYKQSTLLMQMQHFGNVVPNEILEPLVADQWGYRHKARLGVRYVIKKEALLVGFREKQSNYLALIASCEVLHPSVGQLIMPLREMIAKMNAFKEIAQIEVAIGEQQTGLIFRNLVALDTTDQQHLIDFGKQHNLWIYLQPGNADSVVKFYPDDDNLFLEYSLPMYDLFYKFHPLDFTQVNPSINRKMLPLALELLNLQPTDKVLDLFCGLGNFTLPIAQIAKHVVGVEGAEKMVQRAAMNAKINNLTNTRFYAANLMESCEQHAWTKENYTKILIDPPRSGALEILPLIASFNAQTIVYVSCNPATLARDAGELVNKYGYTLTKVGVIDMFPHTAHVESIALFEK